MNKRMDKYKEEVVKEKIKTRSDRNKELYKQVYDAYDEFENLIVPSNAKEIDPNDLNKVVNTRSEYRKIKDYNDITSGSEVGINNQVVRKEKIKEQQQQENEVYDIVELLNKAVVSKKGPTLIEPTLTNDDYLKKLKLDNKKTNIEQVKEIYEEIKEEAINEEDELLKTANLSLEILTDLKGDDDKTFVSPPIKKSELPQEMENDFYSNTYKFSKKDFDDKEYEDNIELLDEENSSDEKKRIPFMKIMLLIFGVSLVIIMVIWVFNYFNRM